MRGACDCAMSGQMWDESSLGGSRERGGIDMMVYSIAKDPEWGGTAEVERGENRTRRNLTERCEKNAESGRGGGKIGGDEPRRERKKGENS